METMYHEANKTDSRTEETANYQEEIISTVGVMAFQILVAWTYILICVGLFPGPGTLKMNFN